MAMDISTVGAKIRFSGAINLTISEFSDEGTPFDAPDIDVSENKKNLNGTMISSRTPAVYPFSVTVIPNSKSDIALSKLLMKSSIQPGGLTAVDDLYVDCVITVPATYGSGAGADEASGARDYTYTKARIKSGPTGPTSSAEGRMGARTYTFEAEGFKPYSGE